MLTEDEARGLIARYSELRNEVYTLGAAVAKAYRDAYRVGERHGANPIFDTISEDGEEIILDFYCCGSSDWVTLPISVLWDGAWWEEMAGLAAARAASLRAKRAEEARKKTEADRATLKRLRREYGE
jgi:hypothetical protein